MKTNPCRRKTCPDTAPRDYEFCSPLCRQVHVQTSKALAKGDKASMAELSALLGIVDAVNLWRQVLGAGNKSGNMGNST